MGMRSTKLEQYKVPSGMVDLSDETANMYGCQPCPKCNQTHRFVLSNDPNTVVCDDCGFTEKAVRPDDYDNYGDTE